MTSSAFLWTGQTVMAAMQDLGRENKKAVGLSDIVAMSSLTGAQVTRACKRLVTAGLVTRVVKSGGAKPAKWKLTQAGQVCDSDRLRSGPKQAHAQHRRPHSVPTLREQFWHLLRCRQKLSIPEALEVLLTPGDDVERASNNLQRYIRGLAKAGYITPLSARSPGTDPRSNGHRRWYLVDDTGRIPPTLLAKGGIYDHNTRSMRP